MVPMVLVVVHCELLSYILTHNIKEANIYRRYTMPEIIKVQKEHQPALRFIGKRYSDADRMDGGFGNKWHIYLSDEVK